jgi:hypothetical protein
MKSKLIEAYKEEHQEVYNKRLGVIFNGEDNLKPTIIENLIDSSPTAFQCAWIYETFLGGGGFEVDLAKVNLSDDEFEFTNPNDLLFDVSESISRHQGVFVHVNYNFNYEKDSYAVVPFSLCRLGKKDSDYFTGKIAISRKGWGRHLKRDEIEVLNVYNPRPEVIQAQVDDAGGWEYYKGQVMFFKISKKHTYPRSLIETAYTFADVENQLGLFYNGTTKRGFEDITFIRHRAFGNKQDQEQFESNIRSLSGLENASSKMVIEDDWNDEQKETGNFKFDSLKNTVDAKKYSHFEFSSSNYIRKAFKDIPVLLVDSVAGKLGNSNGDDMKMAQAIYNSKISKDQEKIEILFAELFRNYKTAINPANNWTVKQYKLLDDGTVDYTKKPNGNPDKTPVEKTSQDLDTEAIRTAQATLRGSVGGVTSILAIQTSVSLKTTTLDSGVAMLINIFGYSDEVARRILGNPETNTPTA